MTESELIEARERYQLAKTAWRDIREQANIDLRLVSGDPNDQWDPAIKAARDTAGKPALTFGRLHTLVQQITNQARQQRPQPRVNPAGDGARIETAEVFEGLMRHIQYASQADVAYDNAVEYSASCGFGFYRITTEYIDDESFDQEPRIRQILDPMTVYFDPSAQEPDFSDAKWCFVRKRMKRDEYRDEHGQEPVAFDDGGMEDWATEEDVWVAEYWRVDIKRRKLAQLSTGEVGFEDELQIPEGVAVEKTRDVEERQIRFDLIDGARSLEKTEWLGKWIPIIPVLGREMVVDGKRHFISIIRYARDAQRLLNAYKSGIAYNVGLTQNPEWIGWMGYKGQFKDRRWDGLPHVEVEPTTIGGQPAPLPTRGGYEPQIQALSQGALQEADDMKASVGYIDSVIQPSQADLSGVAVKRRTAQADLTNFHFEDNLVRSQWHCGRMLLDLIPKVIDVPRAVRILGEDGSVELVAVTQAFGGGEAQMVPGYENVPHHRLDVGRYDVTVATGPSYNTKREEERDMLLQMAQANPATWQIYGDVLWHVMGYEDLAERAKFALLPQIQQAIAGKDQGIPPQVQAQMAQLGQQNAQMKQLLQTLAQKLQTKEIETKGKLDVEKLKLMREMIIEQMRNDHDSGKVQLGHHAGAIEHMMSMLHESEMAPDPAAAASAGNQPQGNQ